MKRPVTKKRIYRFCILSVFSFLLLFSPSIWAQGMAIQLLGDFKEGWEEHWLERKLTQLPSRYPSATDLSEKPAPYQVVGDKDNLTLKLESDESALILWRMLNIHSIKFGKIKWQWKVEKSLTGNKKERRKVGDDYAARLCVIFEPHVVSWKTRAIHYVWAGNEPVGSVFKNPYANSVATIVVESGNEHASKWVNEERNFVMDYERIFGKAPEMVSGVAIMVDTDNTQARASAWFDDIVLELWSPPSQNKSNVIGTSKINYRTFRRFNWQERR